MAIHEENKKTTTYQKKWAKNMNSQITEEINGQ